MLGVFCFKEPNVVSSRLMGEELLLLISCVVARGPPVQKKPLKHRDFEGDLESRFGKTQVVTPVAPLSH
ncbi:hypothetical protein I3842_08G157900 [Carya illinoinensis]|uniref:Uncharacterized protein n=1 Tax=Carya illinoinensis TaxID=32201 RepID=A0A922EGG2_CARIL|nr:hypothetical protein I3842_08G157900 [Carya illinoinensis]